MTEKLYNSTCKSIQIFNYILSAHSSLEFKSHSNQKQEARNADLQVLCLEPRLPQPVFWSCPQENF